MATPNDGKAASCYASVIYRLTQFCHAQTLCDRACSRRSCGTGWRRLRCQPVASARAEDLHPSARPVPRGRPARGEEDPRSWSSASPTRPRSPTGCAVRLRRARGAEDPRSWPSASPTRPRSPTGCAVRLPRARGAEDPRSWPSASPTRPRPPTGWVLVSPAGMSRRQGGHAASSPLGSEPQAPAPRLAFIDRRGPTRRR